MVHDERQEQNKVNPASRINTIERRLMLRSVKAWDGFIPPRGRTYYVGLDRFAVIVLTVNSSLFICPW